MRKIVNIFGIGLGVLILASCKTNNITTSSNELSTTTTTTVSDDYELKITCPSGAPILSIASAVSDFSGNIDTENVGVDASTLHVALQTGSVDLIIAPVNTGMKLYSLGKSNYKLAGVVTWGNTYLASTKEFVLDDITDTDLVLFGQNTVNSFAINYILEEKNITPKSVTYLGTAQNTQAQISSDKICMTAEPMLSNAIKRIDEEVYYESISDLYISLTEHNLPQAAIFVNPNTLVEHEQLVNQFLAMIDLVDEYSKTNPSKVRLDAIPLGLTIAEDICETAIPNSKIDYKKASDAKDDLLFIASESKRYFNEGKIEQNYFGDVTDEFFYN